jgi:hypothetical protein
MSPPRRFAQTLPRLAALLASGCARPSVHHRGSGARQAHHAELDTAYAPPATGRTTSRNRTPCCAAALFTSRSTPPAAEERSSSSQCAGSPGSPRNGSQPVHPRLRRAHRFRPRPGLAPSRGSPRSRACADCRRLAVGFCAASIIFARAFASRRPAMVLGRLWYTDLLFVISPAVAGVQLQRAATRKDGSASVMAVLRTRLELPCGVDILGRQSLVFRLATDGSPSTRRDKRL